MKLENFLQIIMIFLSILAIHERNYFRIVLYFSAFSFVAASLYYMYKAPDVALAEAAIGSAFIPLVFIIAISKQNQFLVLDHANDGFLANDPSLQGKGYKILSEFCSHYKLKLKIYTDKDDLVTGVFRLRNTDLIVEKCPDTEQYIFKGKKASIIMNKLERMVHLEKDIIVMRIGDEDTDD